MSASTAADHLTRQFLGWLAAAPRDYDAVMEGWRSSCPRLTIWEDALVPGLVRIDAGGRVLVTPAGQTLLADR
ncbi:hypothetical protein C8P66_1125 [Humitalea rosea]|uniref:Uncharacterized protein n=1 Tax=Humitalea rosea TaxID=990373 RepID=A0A2W7IDE0_9PROT|nr:hypothetical protein [Humitalea rosea]PZW44990.1 hypothetical protein C8P66_1125 [Humitalea rosea]